MTSVSEIVQKQKEKWCGLEALIEAVARKRELLLNPQVVPENKDEKCGLKINPLKTAVHLQQKKQNSKDTRAILKDSQGPNITTDCQEPDLLLHVDNIIECIEEQEINKSDKMVYMESPSLDTKDISNDDGKTSDSQSTIWPSKTISVVLPIETFNDFKVLVPTNKLEMKTDDGEIVVIEPCDEPHLQLDCSNNAGHENSYSSTILRQRGRNMSVLEMLATDPKQSDIIRWQKYDGTFVYYTDNNEKYAIDSRTGQIDYHNLNIATKFRGIPYTKPSKKWEKIPKLERNLLIPWVCCSKSGSKSLQYGSIIKCMHNKKRSSKSVLKGRLVLKRLRKSYNCTGSARFVLQSTKFGSFMEKFVPDVHTDHNYIKRDFKSAEEKLFTEVKDCLPLEVLLDNTRLGILKSSISYIQQLEKKLKESLGILQPTVTKQSLPDISVLAKEILEDEFTKSKFLDNISQYSSVPLLEDQTLGVDEKIETLQNVQKRRLNDFVPVTETEHSNVVHGGLENDILCEKLYCQLVDCAAIHCSMLESATCVDRGLETRKHLEDFTSTCQCGTDSPTLIDSSRDILRVMNEFKSTGCFKPTFSTRLHQFEPWLESTCTSSRQSPTNYGDFLNFFRKTPIDDDKSTTDPPLYPQLDLGGVDQEEEDGLKLDADSGSPATDEVLLQFNNDDYVMLSQDDVMFQMNYTDVNLNSLCKKEEGEFPGSSSSNNNNNNNSYVEDWKATAKDSWKNCDGEEHLFSPSFAQLNSEGEFSISSP